MGKEKIAAIISKLDWQALLAGTKCAYTGWPTKITLYQDSEVHHYFSDHPEEDTIKVEISRSDDKETRK